MLRSKTTGSSNSDSPEDIIELNEANPSSSLLQSRKIDIENLGLTPDSNNVKEDNNAWNKQSLSNKEKTGNESEDSENNETTNLIYPYRTLRVPKTSATAMEEQAATIANHLERKNKLMQDDPLSEYLRLEMIRNMPQGLTLKRSVKAKLSLSINVALHQIGSTIELWYHPIKKIEGHFGSGIATYFKFLRWLFITNLIGCIFSILFVTLPQALVQSHQNTTFAPWDLLLGNGLFTNSIFYYGFYINDTIVVESDIAYDMPSAYFLTFLFCYIFTFILLCFKVARSYKKCYIETSGGAYNRYANKIFCSWDWGISSYKAASLRSASIYRELEELLWESKHLPSSVSCSMKIWTLLIRVAMSTLIFAIMCGTGALLWLLCNEFETDEKDVVSVLTVPVIMTLIINVFPPLITWSVKYEKYAKDRLAFYISMIRVYVIAVIAVATPLTFWLTRGVQVGCWQTRLAQEIYRLILLDLFVSVFGTFIVQAIRWWRPIRNTIGAPTFNIARNTLSLIYNQSLFWIVHYFSPPMSLIVVVKLLLTFYVKKCELLNFCEPPSKFWRAAQTQTLFLALTFLGMISAITILSYVLIYVDTSSCGPFAGHVYTWEFVVEHVLHVNRESKFWYILGEIANPGTGIALLVVMSVAVYYLRAKAEASKQMVHILRQMLVWQARDKEFLLKTFSSTGDQHWLRHRRSSKLLGFSDSATSDRSQVNEPSTSY